MGTTCSSCALTEDEINEMDMKALKEGKCTNSSASPAARSKAVASAANSSDHKTVAAPAEKIEEAAAAGGMEQTDDAQPAEAEPRPSPASPLGPKEAATIEAPKSPGSPCLLTPGQDVAELSQSKCDECSADDADNAVAAAIAELQAKSEDATPSTSPPQDVPFQFKPSVGTWLIFVVPVEETDKTSCSALLDAVAAEAKEMADPFATKFADVAAAKVVELEGNSLLEEGVVTDAVDETAREVKAEKADLIEPDTCNAEEADLIKPSTSEADEAQLIEEEAPAAEMDDPEALCACAKDLLTKAASDGALEASLKKHEQQADQPELSIDEEKPLKDIVESLKGIVDIVEDVEATKADVDLPAKAECFEPQVQEVIDESQQPESPKKAEF